jgi:hypothetical protein
MPIAITLKIEIGCPEPLDLPTRTAHATEDRYYILRRTGVRVF